MKTLLKIASLTLIAALAAGCATIVDGGPQAISIGSQPSGAKVSITNRAGQPVHVQNTPFVVSLPRGAGYFSGEDYKLVFELTGYKAATVEIHSRVDGWYIGGNFFFGGAIGWLIVDPLTGSMWTLTPDKVEQTLTNEQASLIQNGQGFVVVLKSQTTESEQANMVPLPVAL